ncbi:MAG: hypothetical protein PHP26_07260 [Syntrophomonas sp.]|nr:hypothetical protein [Syntrophomonas sp.]
METIDVTKPEVRKQQLQTSENDLLVIGVPVYVGRVPTIAIDWLYTLQARSTPTVCIVVCWRTHFFTLQPMQAFIVKYLIK